jgi:hypothetical protein
MKRLIRLLFRGLVFAGIAWGYRVIKARRISQTTQETWQTPRGEEGLRPQTANGAGNGQGKGLVERRSAPDPAALAAAAEQASRFGLDLERLRLLKPDSYKPLVEYLTYIQVQRGSDESLIFVRGRDIDRLAELSGEPKEEVIDQFQKLGVLLSMN